MALSDRVKNTDGQGRARTDTDPARALALAASAAVATEDDLSELFGVPDGSDDSDGPAASSLQPTVSLERVDVEAVVGGVLMRLSFRGVTQPGAIAGWLKAQDAGAKWRDDFPKKFDGKARETKSALVKVITLRASDSGLFWDLVAVGDGDELSVSVSKKLSGDFADRLRLTEALAPERLVKLTEAIAGKKTATLILTETEGLVVKYWTTDDGKAFVEGVEKS